MEQISKTAGILARVDASLGHFHLHRNHSRGWPAFHHYLGDSVDSSFEARAHIELEARGEEPQMNGSLANLPKQLIRSYGFCHVGIIEQYAN